MAKITITFDTYAPSLANKDIHKEISNALTTVAAFMSTGVVPTSIYDSSGEIIGYTQVTEEVAKK